VELASLGAEFSELTGEPSPFGGTSAPSPHSLLAEVAALVREIAASAERDISEVAAWFSSHGL
jgi:hypothetical protein